MHVIDLLTLDVVATLGAAHRRVAFDVAAHVQACGNDLDRIVDDVQQHLHDERIDTTWPACPRHPNHPMDFGDGWWWCPRDLVAVVPLGRLGAHGDR